MISLAVGLGIFFGVHAVSILNESWRDRMIAKLGEAGWKGLYSLVSIIGFVLLVRGYGQARLDSAVLYDSAPWLKHLAMTLMLPVFPLLLATYIPGRIRTFVRHPMLIATLLWASAHLLVNGQLCDLLLFGAFFLWAGWDLWSMRGRAQRLLPGPPASKFNDLIILLLGVVLYLLFVLKLHSLVIGVPIIASS